LHAEIGKKVELQIKMAKDNEIHRRRAILVASRWERSKTVLSDLLDKIDKHEVFTQAGALAYTTALALAPFLVIMLSATAFLGPEKQTLLVSQMTRLLGSDAGEAVKSLVDQAQKRPTLGGIDGLISFVVILISASATFSQLRVALDKLNEHKTNPMESGLKAFVRYRILSIGLVLGFIFLLVISLFFTTAVALVFHGLDGFLWETIAAVFNLILFSFLFAAMFRFIPSDKFRWKRCWISGASAAVFFILGKSIIGIYLGKSAVGSAYGAAGSFAVLLIWLYYSSMTLLLSYDFTTTVFIKDKDEHV